MSLKARFSDDFTIECGCDEAGRGCLAGPVFAAAVILPCDYENEAINDSKQLSARRREQLRGIIERDALTFAVASVTAREIDEINILNASILAMNRAVAKLTLKPQLLLIDGNRFTDKWHIPYRCIVRGDATFLSIAAASILAKTYRDDFMTRADARYPMYYWKQNKGYPTAQHTNAIAQYGLSPLHRQSFHLRNIIRTDV